MTTRISIRRGYRAWSGFWVRLEDGLRTVAESNPRFAIVRLDPEYVARPLHGVKHELAKLGVDQLGLYVGLSTAAVGALPKRPPAFWHIVRRIVGSLGNGPLWPGCAQSRTFAPGDATVVEDGATNYGCCERRDLLESQLRLTEQFAE